MFQAAVSRSAAERSAETHTRTIACVRACAAWWLMHDAVSGRVRQAGLETGDGNAGLQERAREIKRGSDGETRKASAMLARTYVDRVLNYVLESCTFRA